MRAVVVLVAVSGCFFDSPFETSDSRNPCIPFERARTHVGRDALERTYLVTSIDLPDSVSDAQSTAFDIDRDELSRPDNALGNIVSALGSVDAGDIDGAANEAIERGQLLHLLTIRAPDFDAAPGATLDLRHGIDDDGDPTDNVSGQESFSTDPSRGSGHLGGTIGGGVLRVSGGQLPIELAVPGDPEIFPLHLDVAHLEATITDAGLSGRIGGAVPADQVRETFFPFLARAVEVAVERDCPDGTCVPDSFGDLVIRLFDEDGDGAVSLEELEESGIVRSLFAPDVDIRNMSSETSFDGDLVFNCDGFNDALSIGFEFSAVPAAI